MKTEFERIEPDEGSSFRLLHQRVAAEDFGWHYHYHPEYEMVLVFDGTGRRHVGNHLSYYEGGDLVFIGSNLPHSGFGFGSVGEHEEIVIQFLEDFLGENIWEKPEMQAIKMLFAKASQGIHFYGETRKIVTEKLKNLPKLSHFDKMLNLLQIFQILANSQEFQLLNAAETRYDFNQKDEIRLKKIYNYVEKNYQKPIDIREVADIASLTVPAFCNYFKKVINLTFTDFVNEYRINQACKLLTEEKSIVDVCFACGFNNVSYFSKIFKATKGKTPRDFRKMVLRK